MKQVNSFRDHKDNVQERALQRLHAQEEGALQSRDGILDYIAQLMDEGQYGPALKVWRETAFEGLPDKTEEYYRLGMLVMDELLLLGGKRRQDEEDGAANVGERAKDAVRRQLASREERARELERQAEEMKGRLSEVTLALEMAQ